MGILFPWMYLLLLLYVLLLFIDATCQYKGKIWIGMLSVAAAFTQLFGYGTGFIRAWWKWKLNQIQINGVPYRYAKLDYFCSPAFAILREIM